MDDIKFITNRILAGKPVKEAVADPDEWWDSVPYTKTADNGKKIYLGTLYRFGSDYTCVDTNKKACEQAILDAYRHTYIMEYGDDPVETSSRAAGKSDMEAARDDIEWKELTIGNVEFL